jgi:hypothetical protein
VQVLVGGQISGLKVASTHTGFFTAGQTGANYYIVVTVPEFAPYSGTVTVTDTLPAGFTATAITGYEWNCVLSTLTCTHTTALAGGTPDYTIIVTVNVPSGIELPVVNNSVSVVSSLGTNTGTDPTSIILGVMMSLNVTPSFSTLDQAVTMTATLGSGLSGTVLFLDGLNALGEGTILSGKASFTTSLLQAGVHQLAAFYSDHAGHAGYSPIVNFTVSAAPAATLSATNDSTGSQPAGIAIGDFNNDGKADLATANSGTNTVSVLVGNGDGTFAAHVDYPVGATPYAVAVGDFNADGRQDLVAVNQSSSTYSILLGNGDGTFQTASSSAVTLGSKPVVAVGDFNRDGIEDLAIGNASTGLSISFGNGDGTFQAPVITSFPVGTTLLIQDLNGDGNADLIVGNGYFDALLGKGDGNFAQSSWIGFGTGTIAIGDLNGDGKVDVAFSEGPSSPMIAIQLGNGDGTFSGSQTYPISFLPSYMAIADVNGDGKLDLIAASSGSSSIIVMPGNGDGTLQSALSYSIGSSAAGLAVGDFNEDGRTDLAFSHGSASNNVTVLLGSGAASLIPAPVSVTPGSGSGLTQTFTFTFSDPNGYADLSVLDILVNNYLDGIGACYVALVPASATSGYLYLVADAGGGYVSGTPALLPSSGSFGNSQCTVNGAGSSFSGSGNTLTVTLNITFAPAFAGNKIFYTAARSATQNSGWQALGTWSVPGPAVAGPGVGGVTPGRSVTLGQTYTFTFTDSNGYGDLAVLDVLTNSFLDGISGCYFAYVPISASNGYLYLVDDAGDGGYASGSPIPLSSGGTLKNSQCTLSTIGSSASASGNSLNLNLAITFNPSFAGNQVFYLASRNSTGGNSGWQAGGSVTVP